MLVDSEQDFLSRGEFYGSSIALTNRSIAL